MNPTSNGADGTEPQPETEGRTISPLPGEPGIPDVAERPHRAYSRKGLLAVGLLLGSLVAVAAITVQRFAASGRNADEAGAQRIGDRPTAASMAPRQLEIPPPSASAVAPAATPKIPALLPALDEAAEPIGVRRTGPGAPSASSTKSAAPEDAPVLLVSTRPGARSPTGLPAALPLDTTNLGNDTATPSAPTDPNDPLRATTRNLQGYQRQLQGVLDSLTKSAALATGQPGAAPVQLPLGTPLSGLPPLGGLAVPGSGLFGGQLQGSATPRVAASVLGNRSLTLPKGTAFTCALKTKVISAASGLVGCQVQRNVFSDDGRVLLIERGSHLDGEYRITSVRPGTVRIPVLWTRIRTPLGVTVDIDSPGTGPLGESGIDGFVDNRWGERIGAAMLLSLIDDSVKLIIQNQASDTQADTIVLPSTTSNTSKLAEKVLDSTINIPPLIYQNQGGIVGIYVARDVDFSSVYELQPVAR